MSIATELLEKYRATGFAEFRGLHIAGRIPVAQEVINEIIAELLRDSRTMTAGQNGVGQPGGASFSIQELAQFVRRAEVTAADGKVTLDFELGV